MCKTRWIPSQKEVQRERMLRRSFALTMTRTQLWRHVAVLKTMVAFLDADDLEHLSAADEFVRKELQKWKTKFHRLSARTGLGMWLGQQARIRFRSFAQTLQTERIERSVTRDPRVPPRVVPIWVEAGAVEDGDVALSFEVLPRVLDSGVILRFQAAPTAATQPMLMSVAQGPRRIYTIVTVEIQKPDATAIVLRKYCYIKDFHEFQSPPPPTKKAYEEANALCRFDLLSTDGSVALELDVPRGADASVDYYLVKRGVVCLHTSELFQQYASSLRPCAPLPVAADASRQCIMEFDFRDLTGRLQRRVAVPGTIVVETQIPQAAQSRPQTAPRPTDSERFHIITVRHDLPSPETYRLPLPHHPGYLWIGIRMHSSRLLTYYAVICHQGRVKGRVNHVLQANWLPGVLEFQPTPTSIHRRELKGRLHVAVDAYSQELRELQIIAQMLPAERMQRYAASMDSYTRYES